MTFEHLKEVVDGLICRPCDAVTTAEHSQASGRCRQKVEHIQKKVSSERPPGVCAEWHGEPRETYSNSLRRAQADVTKESCLRVCGIKAARMREGGPTYRNSRKPRKNKKTREKRQKQEKLKKPREKPKKQKTKKPKPPKKCSSARMETFCQGLWFFGFLFFGFPEVFGVL